MVDRPTSERPLLILAMDHRDSFGELFGVDDDQPNESQLDRMRAAKRLIYLGLRAAIPRLSAGAQPGVLVDEELGADVLREAAADQVAVAMPVERSGQKTFALQYGTDTPKHVDAFDPDYVKVLVRMNPDDDATETDNQLTALSQLSRWLQTEDRPLLYELLVPGSQDQLREAGGEDAYDRDVRPGLVCDLIVDNQDAGVEPTLWKIEGLETSEAAARVVAAAHRDGRDADCIVLGRDAPRERLDHWLQVASAVPGFVGFAIGRSIWQEPLTEHIDDGDDQRLIAAVAESYLHYADTYLGAR